MGNLFSSPDPPDYGPLAEASSESARIMGELGNRSIDFNERQFAVARPFLTRIAESQINIQNEQLAAGQEDRRFLTEQFRPLERGIVRDAERFSTAAHRDRLAAQASRDAALAFRTTQASTNRSLASMGVNPNSGRFADTQRQNAVALAAQRAGAATGSRMQSEQLGFARRLDAAGLGRNLPGASAAAYSGAVGAGTNAGSNLQSPTQVFNAGFTGGASIIGQGRQIQQQGLSNILNAQTQMYVNGQSDPLGSIGALAGGAAGLFQAFSDRRKKENIREVGVEPRTGLTLYEFNYVEQPGRTFVGVMSDEVRAVAPSAVSVSEDGFDRVDYGMLGIQLQEV